MKLSLHGDMLVSNPRALNTYSCYFDYTFSKTGIYRIHIYWNITNDIETKRIFQLFRQHQLR